MWVLETKAFTRRHNTEGKLSKTILGFIYSTVTDAKPTFWPPAPIKINSSQTTTVTQEKQKTTTTGLPQTEEIALSTTHTSTFGLRNGEVVSSSSSQSKVNLVVVILSALSGVLFATLALLAVFFLLSRRRRYANLFSFSDFEVILHNCAFGGLLNIIYMTPNLSILFTSVLRASWHVVKIFSMPFLHVVRTQLSYYVRTTKLCPQEEIHIRLSMLILFSL